MMNTVSFVLLWISSFTPAHLSADKQLLTDADYIQNITN